MRIRSACVAVFLAVGLATPPTHAQSATDPDAPVDVPAGDEYADTDPSALSDFRPALDPYGSWADDPTYGTVWAPTPDQTGPDFQPYDTAGSWDYVDGDYVWVSDYAWGWVCFHYGRWAFSGGRWVWIPGRDYAGAWVTWSVGDDAYGYVGWAPMAPSWVWVGGGATPLGFASPEPWAFTTYVELLSANVSSRVVTGLAATTVAAHSRSYVPAKPGVAPAPGSQPVPHGPPPAMLGIDLSHTTPLVLGSRELRARLLSHPSTAQPIGAHAPIRHVVRQTPRFIVPTRMVAGGARGTARGRR